MIDPPSVPGKGVITDDNGTKIFLNVDARTMHAHGTFSKGSYPLEYDGTQIFTMNFRRRAMREGRHIFSTSFTTQRVHMPIDTFLDIYASLFD